MNKKFINIFNMIKSNKRYKYTLIVTIMLLFISIIGYSLSIFNKDNSMLVANIKVNDLVFNITTNSGTSDDRILHLKTGKIESFKIIITNLNKIDTKYELTYEVCSDSNCKNKLNELPDEIEVGLNPSLTSEVSGTIVSNKVATVNILTENNTDKDYYIKLNLNAGYTWNDLALVNQFDYFSKTTSIIAYVDGVEVAEYPGGCNYKATLKGYKGNSEVELENKSVTCNSTTKKWNISYTGFASKIKIYFEETTFANDSWETIAAIVKSGNTTAYPVGSEKEVEIDGKSYTVRVANNTMPDQCSRTDFSQTACGFVVEFVDIVEQRAMNSTGTEEGGWLASELRTYANGEFFNKLPSDLQKVIIDTKAVSGAMLGETNYISTDKIYLLSGHEVYEDEFYMSTNVSISIQDDSYDDTRQLDYYRDKGVTMKNYSSAIKQYNSSNSEWRLRSGWKIDNGFLSVSDSGSRGISDSEEATGFAPAFRISDKENLASPTSFAKDSWETIANNVKTGNSSRYNIGDEKEVKIGGTSYTVRVANNITPDECNQDDFSQTACGFVVEFVDIVEKRTMNSTDTNVGGWPATELRTYANKDFFNKLPSDLQNVIIDTKVISGHGSTSGETNFTSTDKIYLLSVHEVWEDGTSNKVSTWDTAYNNTRQLDYYKNNRVTTNSYYYEAIKLYNGSYYSWFLRVPVYDTRFIGVAFGGGLTPSIGIITSGFAPAFRIG